MAALQKLSERDREVLELRHLEQLSVAETAAALGVSEAVVKTRHLRTPDTAARPAGTSRREKVMSATANDVAVDAVLADLIEELTDRLQVNLSDDVEAFLAQHPDHAEQLRKMLPALQLLAVSGPGEPGALATGETAFVNGVLGDFRIIREVGRGGMGIVYEAEQISLSRRVALKVLPFAATMDSRHLQRFHNEARAAANLHHTNIVPVHYVGCERSVHFYAMQFIDGQSLAGLLEQQRRGPANSDRPTTAYGTALPQAGPAADTAVDAAARTASAPRDAAYFRRVAEWGIQAAEALDYAHQMGIVHRDVKPANLLVDGHGQLWVTDFGLARLLADPGLTMTGDLVGTLRYMSPEQALAQHGLVDHRTDVYSLGATLYELLTGRPAVEGRDRQAILNRLAGGESRPPRAYDKGVPADLETIVLKALAREPVERYATAQELADDLRRFLEHRSIWARRPSWVQRVRKWLRRHQAVVTAATTTLAVALAVSTLLISRERDSTLSALRDAEAQRARAEERELLARRQLYAAHIAEARRAWEVANLGVVQRFLEQHIPRPGEEDLRGFEWYYLWGLCRGRQNALLTLRGHIGEVNCASSPRTASSLSRPGRTTP